MMEQKYNIEKYGKILFLPSGRKTNYISKVKKLPGYEKYFDCPDVRIYLPYARAELIYDAITKTDLSGNYVYHNIYFFGGNGADDTVNALEKLQQVTGKKLPERWNNLNIFGFSDASQLFHYFGQRGIATPIYYSGMNKEKFLEHMAQVMQKQESYIQQKLKPTESNSFIMNLEVLQAPPHIQQIQGFTQPGSVTSVEIWQAHQMQPFSEGSNMLIVELTNSTQVDRLAEIINRVPDKSFSLILSQNIPPQIIPEIKQKFPNMLIFWGAPVGHHKEKIDSNDRPFPLFAASQIYIHDNGAATILVEPIASKKAKELQNNSKRTYPKIVEDAQSSQKVTVHGTDDAGRAVIQNLSEIKQNASQYIIELGGTDQDAWQKMELSVKELLAYKIIDPDKLTQLHFTGTAPMAQLARKTVPIISSLASMYLPKLEKCTYNEEEIPVIDLSKNLLNSEKLEKMLDWAFKKENSDPELERQLEQKLKQQTGKAAEKLKLCDHMSEQQVHTWIAKKSDPKRHAKLEAAELILQQLAIKWRMKHTSGK